MKCALINHAVKYSEINRLHATKVKKLEIEVEDLKDHLFRKCKENSNIKHYFENYKKVSQENIGEKDNMLGCLENELERTKADAEIIVEEFEKCTNKKISFEKTIADMKMKFGRYREIIYLMKDSLSGLAALHEDTSDKLIDVVMKTAHASRVVVKNAKKQFHGLENEISSLNQDPILVDEMVHNNNVVNVKKEPEDGLGEESSSNTVLGV